MIEIVFSESAGGSLCIAQSFGKGPYREPALGILVSHGDGSAPAPEELEREKCRYREKMRKAWKNAVPIGGNASDIFIFPLALSVGDIRENGCRADTIQRLLSFADAKLEKYCQMTVQSVPQKLSEIRQRLADGEAARVWYSENPDEYCGFLWLMAQLDEVPASLFQVKLPTYTKIGETAVCAAAWGEVAPEEWHVFLAFQAAIPGALKRAYAQKWRELQRENAPLRAVLSGHAVSVAEDFYDGFIRKEIQLEPDTFQEAVVIGRVLGKYQLGISDGFIANRIEKMVETGELTPKTCAKEEEPSYWRILQKGGRGE